MFLKKGKCVFGITDNDKIFWENIRKIRVKNKSFTNKMICVIINLLFLYFLHKEIIMVKKSICSFIFIMMFIATCKLVCAADEDICAEISSTAEVSLPDTPRPHNASLFGEQDPEKVASATEIYNNFLQADPEIFLLTHEGQLNIKWTDIEEAMTEEEYAFVKSTAEDITKDCTTNARKIQAVAEYVAKNTCYDYDYSEHGTKVYSELALTPYTVLTEKNTVCEGYSRACEGLLQSIGIPCVYVLCPDHSWNMAYDGERWILFDSTWMSNGIYEYGNHKFSSKLNSEWYDFTFETACSEYNHLIEEVPYMVKGGKLSKYPVYSAAEDILITDEVTYICEYTLRGCTQTGIVIPKTVKHIESNVFSEHSCSIQRIHIDSIGAWLGMTFEDISSNPACSGGALYVDGEMLTDIVVPDNITNIGRYAFAGCSGVKKITLGDSVTKAYPYSFWFCEDLCELELSPNMTTIEYSAFSNCNSLEKVTIPNSITTIESYAFYECTALKEITLPDSVTTIENSAFDSSGIESITIPNNIKEIANYTFYNCKNLKSITLPKHLENIGYYAFTRCESLEKIVIPAGVVSIGKQTFEGCTSLVSVTLPESITAIAPSLFKSCTSLKEVTVPKNVKSISEKAFMDCNGLEKVILPSGLSVIGASAFENCTSLTDINLPESITALEEHAFFNCKKLCGIILPENIERIGKYAFYGCIALDGIYIPGSISEISASTFSNCTSLKTVTVGHGVKTVNEKAFNGCTSLVSIAIPDSITDIGNRVFAGCTSLKRIALPHSITSIGERAFSGCTGLVSITIPYGVTTIEKYTFNYCPSLKSITVHENITEIADNAFVKCEGLRTVRYTGNESRWNSIVIGEGNDYLTDAELYLQSYGICSASADIMEPGTYGENTDSIVVGMDAGITAETLKAMLVYSDRTSVKVFDDNGNEISLDNDIRNGYKLRHFASDGTLLAEAVIAVKGDVNCDGKIDITDITAVMMLIAGADSDIFKACADLDLDGNVTIADINLFMSMIKQKTV